MPLAGRTSEELKPVRIGCSGWHYPHWRGVLYPPGTGSSRWLGLYAKVFDTVETNSTFYRLPTEQTVAGWAAQVPDGFVFAVKVSRFLTHIKRLSGIEEALERFEQVIEPLAVERKLGPCLWQLPPSFARNEERLRSLLETLERSRHAFEFRHPSWFCQPVYELLREHGAALVIADHPTRSFGAGELTASFVYLRFHLGLGPLGCYTSEQISSWANRIAEWGKDREVFAYFNNDGHGCAVRDALALTRALGMGSEIGLE